MCMSHGTWTWSGPGPDASGSAKAGADLCGEASLFKRHILNGPIKDPGTDQAGVGELDPFPKPVSKTSHNSITDMP